MTVEMDRCVSTKGQDVQVHKTTYGVRMAKAQTVFLGNQPDRRAAHRQRRVGASLGARLRQAMADGEALTLARQLFAQLVTAEGCSVEDLVRI